MVMIVGTYTVRRATNVSDNSKVAGNSGLIARARCDSAAFVQLYRRHYDAVFRYCVHRLFERQTAEDVTSETFLKVVQSLPYFKSDDEQQFRNWLYKIATNAVNNHLRKAARRNTVLERLSEQMSDESHGFQEPVQNNLACLRKAVLSLKPRYQTIITLRFFENLKLSEIAEVLGSSPGTVRSQLARALAKLRRRLVAAADGLPGGAEK
jgi:RNA polymerase sigma-70 factor (ECF subfamily)